MLKEMYVTNWTSIWLVDDNDDDVHIALCAYRLKEGLRWIKDVFGH